jgi:integrase
MASISHDTYIKNGVKKRNGCKTLQFMHTDRRRSVRLGKITSHAADAIRAKVEAILSANYSQQAFDNETSVWIAKLDSRLHDKLAKFDLFPARKKTQSATVAAFIDGYRSSQDLTLAKSTRDNHRQTRDDLVKYFGADTQLSHITAGDADEWRNWLVLDKDRTWAGRQGRGLGDNSARKRCSIARQFFNVAIKKNLISKNPFADVKGGVSVRANRAREQFVERDTVDAAISACDDNEFKLVIALARYGAFRCPSELCGLRWVDIHWNLSRITVTSPKTAHHANKATRIIPLFNELRPYLELVRSEQLGSERFVLSSRYRRSDANLRTTLRRVLEQAGIKPWPKLFQNLRASRAIELAQENPAYVAAEWTGHSEKVAEKHYLRVTESDFAKALQKCMQQPAATDNFDSQSAQENPTNPSETLELVGSSVLPVGIEPTTY